MTKFEVDMKLVYQAIKDSRIEQQRVRRMMWEKEHQLRHQRLVIRTKCLELMRGELR